MRLCVPKITYNGHLRTPSKKNAGMLTEVPAGPAASIACKCCFKVNHLIRVIAVFLAMLTKFSIMHYIQVDECNQCDCQFYAVASVLRTWESMPCGRRRNRVLRAGWRNLCVATSKWKFLQESPSISLKDPAPANRILYVHILPAFGGHGGSTQHDGCVRFSHAGSRVFSTNFQALPLPLKSLNSTRQSALSEWLLFPWPWFLKARLPKQNKTGESTNTHCCGDLPPKSAVENHF